MEATTSRRESHMVVSVISLWLHRSALFSMAGASASVSSRRPGSLEAFSESDYSPAGPQRFTSL